MLHGRYEKLQLQFWLLWIFVFGLSLYIFGLQFNPCLSRYSYAMEAKGKFVSARSCAAHTRTKKRAHNSGRKKIFDEEEVNNCSETLSGMKGRGGKRSKRRKTCDAIKKRKHDEGRVISLKTSPKPSQSPDIEIKSDNLDSPVLEDTQESSSCSVESNEVLCMSSLLKTVLDRKKMLLLESPEILQFLKNQRIKEEKLVE